MTQPGRVPPAGGAGTDGAVRQSGVGRARGEAEGAGAEADAAIRASILLVDDQPANLLALEAVLEPLGQQLVRARSGAEAVERLRGEDFAVVLLDVQMPGLDGFETAARIRALRQGRLPVPVLFLTARDRDAAEALQGYALGAADFLTKPLEPAVVRAKVALFVDLFVAREQARRRAAAEEYARAEAQVSATLLAQTRRAEELQARRARQAALGADVGVALTRPGALREILQRCAEALVERLEAAFARVWTVDAAGATLELQASAGLYTHLDGPHARVPVGAFKIGRIAEERAAHLTNDVQNDPRVGDRAWAAREGMVSFAGYPLLVEGHLLGVVALFARRALAPDTLEALASVADTIALGIERKRADEDRARLFAAAERSAARLHFLAEASAVLAASLEYEATLASVARLAVPAIGDWCAIDIVEPGGAIRRLAVEHVDPTKVALARELHGRYPPDPDAPSGVPHVVRTGRSEITPEIPDALIEASAADPEHRRIIRALGLRSSMCVPLVARERVLGAISLVTAESGRVYGADDLSLAQELGQRAGAAVDNARLYAEARALLAERDRARGALEQLNATLEERVRERTAQLTEANKELEAFSYTVSHDLRAPIRHVAGFVDLLERHAGDKLDERARRYVRTIAESARQMGTLIDALLAFSRIGRSEMARTPVDLNRVVRDAVRGLEPDAAGRAVRWRIGALPAVEGDPTLLRLVVGNLLSNALKYTRPRPEAEIEVGARVLGGEGGDAAREHEVYVRDNGVGFNPSYAHKLFGVFQRLHVDAQFDGTGIGLATVRRIVQRHGGRVWAEGAPDAGATFHFTLPRREGPPEPEPA